MRDQLVPGTDLAVYWIEHVLRHGGTKHLHVAAKDVSFFQKHLVDVVLFLVAILGGVTFFIYCMIRCLVLQCQRIRPVKLKR